MKSRIAFAVMLLLSGGVSAEVVVSEKVIPEGWFVSTDGECKSVKGEEVPAYCYCAEHIRYPELSGMKNVAAQDKINQIFKESVSSCYGVPTEKYKGEYGFGFETNSFKVNLDQNGILSITLIYQGMGGGAAHPMDSVTSYIFNKETGESFAPNQVFGKNIPQVNKYLVKQVNRLTDTPPLDLNTKFIHGDKCDSCSIVLEPKGVKVIFDVGSVGSMAKGGIEVIIPKKFITSPDILQALGGS